MSEKKLYTCLLYLCNLFDFYEYNFPIKHFKGCVKSFV